MGHFADEVDAAVAYDKAAVILGFMAAAFLNFPLANYLDADGGIIEDRAIRERLEMKG